MDSHIIRATFFRWLPWLIIAIGFILRLDQYLFNRSLWLDEALFVVNVVDRTFLELFEAPLEYTGYIMPPGVLVMAKLFVTLFGNNEFVLRLFPFLCGTISLLLFYKMAKLYVSASAVPLALFFFAISDTLIFYSSEFKQYSSDVMIVIILFLLVAHLRANVLTFAKLLFLTIVGMIAVWFSHSSVFILATIGIYLALPFLLNKQWSKLIKLATVYGIWLFNFAILYFFFINIDIPLNKWLHEFWIIANAFMPSPFSSEGLYWLYRTFFMALKYPGGLGNVYLAGYLVIIGCIVLFANKKETLFLLIFPALIALFASSLQQYAFSGRLLLFLMPILYLIIAEGIMQIQVKLLTYPKIAIVTGVAQVILVAHLIDYPIYHRHVVQEIKPILEHVQKNRQNQDLFYIYYWAEPAFRYYAKNYNFNYGDCHTITPIPHNEFIKEVDYSRSVRVSNPILVDEIQCILGASEIFPQSQPDLEQLQGRGRVWFIFSHIGDHERRLFLNYLDTIGTKLDENLQPGTSVYLYKI